MKRPKLTIRARLTLVYGGLFMLAGLLVLGITYVLMRGQWISGGGQVYTEGKGIPPSNEPSAAPPVMSKIVDDTRGEALSALLTQGGVALVIVGAAAIAIGWLIAGRMLHPLQQITGAARRIAERPAADKGLHERIGLSGPSDELKELADTFDVMLERLDHSFDGQRTFIANASHELRTPLTLNRALLEVAVHREAASEEVRQLGATLLEINTRHERLIDGLLLLARSEPQVTDRSYVDLADIVEHVVEQAPPGKVEVVVDAEEAPTLGNLVLLERLVQNLVENAIRYNLPDGGWVRVSSRTDEDGSAVLAVCNTGPLVPKYEMEGLFEPFRRLGGDRLASTAPGGAGLGLSIVRTVARSHGGDVRAEPREDGGLEVTVTLPGAP